MRRRSGKQGRPQSVFDPETGTPLEIELDSGIDDLRPYGSGGYRLDAIDGSGKVIAGVTAYVEVPAEEVNVVEPQSAVGNGRGVPRADAAAARVDDREHACAGGDGVGVRSGETGESRRIRPEPVVVAAQPPTEQQTKDWSTKILEALPAVAQVMPMMMQVFQSAVAQAQGSVSPTGGDSTPPVQA